VIVAIVQARVGSSRLPGKVLMDLCGESMVERVMSAASSASLIDEVVAAIPVTKEDDALNDLLQRRSLKVFRGSTDDVLDRYYTTALSIGMSIGDHIVRITADCPLMLPSVIDDVVREHQARGVDYTSNVRPPTYPDGLDVEVFSFESLEKAAKNAVKPSEREHVTPFIFQNAATTFNLVNHTDLSDVRLTVDHQDDLEFVREFITRFERVNFQTLRSCVEKINDVRLHQRNEGYAKSLKEDRNEPR